MSLMQWFTRSPPTVECTPVAMATFSLVPTPSALETSTGSFHFFLSNANSAPNPPMPPRTPGVKVRIAWWRIRCFAASASAMSTPASAYFIEDLFSCGSVTGYTKLRVILFRKRPERHAAGSQAHCRFCREENLKGSEQAPPAHQARMHQGIRIGKEALANLTGLPGVGRHIEGHGNHPPRPDHVVGQGAFPHAGRFSRSGCCRNRRDWRPSKNTPPPELCTALAGRKDRFARWCSSR